MTVPLIAVARAVRRFEKDEIGVAALQSSIASNGSAVEGASPDLVAALRAADADLEHIQHAMLLEQQRSAALEALGPVMRELERCGAGVRSEIPERPLNVGLNRDTESDCAYLYLCDVIPHGTVDRAVDCGPITLDFDRLGRLVGIEIRSASELLSLPLDEESFEARN